jgi:hypothetical protein
VANTVDWNDPKIWEGMFTWLNQQPAEQNKLSDLLREDQQQGNWMQSPLNWDDVLPLHPIDRYYAMQQWRQGYQSPYGGEGGGYGPDMGGGLSMGESVGDIGGFGSFGGGVGGEDDPGSFDVGGYGDEEGWGASEGDQN